MTKEEKALLDSLGECWNQFTKLSDWVIDGARSCDTKDFEFHIHALQNIVLARNTMREIADSEE
jgi:hypothetical protein